MSACVSACVCVCVHVEDTKCKNVLEIIRFHGTVCVCAEEREREK